MESRHKEAFVGCFHGWVVCAAGGGRRWDVGLAGWWVGASVMVVVVDARDF